MMNLHYPRITRYMIRTAAAIFLVPTLCTSVIYAQNDKKSKQNLPLREDTRWQKGGIFEGFTPNQEITEKRSKNTKHFRNANGSITAQIGRTLHYKAADGSWQDVNMDIVPDKTSNYHFKNETNNIKSYFPQTPGQQGVSMKLESGDQFNWWKTPTLKFTNNGQILKTFAPAAVTATAQGDKLLYFNVYNGISEEFVVLTEGLENNTIIHSLTPEINALQGNSNLEFTQFIPLKSGWQVIVNNSAQNGNFEANDFSIQLPGVQNSIFFGRIVVFDNNISKDDAMLVNAPPKKLSAEQKTKLEKSVYTVTYKVRFVNGGIEITSSLPASWLKSSNRSFPVVIDPTVTITPVGVENEFSGPITHWYGYQRHADLYLQSEIGNYGSITQIEYNCTIEGDEAGSKPTKVYMRSTAATTLTGTAAWNSTTYTSGAMLCLDANTDQGNTTGWKPLVLTTPFTYNEGNLLIMVNDSWGGGGSVKYYNISTNMTARQAYRRADDTDPGDGTATSIEDYLPEIRITYSPLTTCSVISPLGTPTASVTEVCLGSTFSLNVSGVAPGSGITYQWQASTNGGTTWTNIGTAQNGSFYTVTDQAQATQYRVIVTCTSTGSSQTSATVSVGQKIPSTCYCINEFPFDCTDGDRITNVTFSTINNNSTCGNTTTGYSDYTTTVAAPYINAGTTVPISVTVGGDGESSDESVAVWIDFNQNGILDSTEYEYTDLGTGADEILTGNVVVPLNAVPGPTRMRVVVYAYEDITNNLVCGPIEEDYGEIEDYTVNIIGITDSIVVTTQGNVPATIATPTGTLQLEAKIYPLTLSQGVTWSIVPVTGTAIISATGLVTGQTVGTVWGKAVSVQNTSKKDSILITINPPSPEDVVVKTVGNIAASISVPVGTLPLQATVYPTSLSQAVTWSIVPVTGTATISATGVVTAQTNGTVWGKAKSVLTPAKSDSILITITNQNLGIEDLGGLDFTLYPNPTEDIVVLQSSTNHTELELQLTDLSGKILARRKVKANELNSGVTVDLSNQPSGIYLLKLEGASVRIHRQVIRK